MNRGSRDRILRRIRKAKRHGEGCCDTVHPAPDVVACDESELISLLRKNLESTGTAFDFLENPDELGEVLRRAFDELGAGRVVIFPEEIPGGNLLREKWPVDAPESTSFEIFFGMDLKVVESGGIGGFLDSVDVCVTGCSRIAAEGGVCAIDSSSESGRLSSLLPPHHIVVARRTNVDMRLDDLMESVSFGKEEEMSSVILLSGPSRTADIEKQLVLGVHGPLSLRVILVPPR